MSAFYFRNIKTLVLEKTGSNMNIIDSYLRSLGMHCELTTSEESAGIMLETANKPYSSPFDLFILDYDTPEKKGFSFVETLRKGNRITKMPRIIMLLPSMREDLFDALDANGIDLGIGKPVIPSILFKGILDIFKARAFVANKVVGDDTDTEAVEERSAPTEGNSHTVLLVEDNTTNQMIARSLLEDAGFTVIIADNGKEGVESFKENKDKIDLILMDLHMPVMNGYEAASAIREISKDIPIVAMTADVVLGVKEECMKHGIYQYISKPFDPEKFSDKLKEIIGKGAAPEAVSPPALLDREKALILLGNNEELYKAVLKEYLNENLETPEKLLRAIDEKRYEEAEEMLHKLKSSTGSIGATEVYKRAVSLQKALMDKNEQMIASDKDEFAAMLSELLEQL